MKCVSTPLLVEALPFWLGTSRPGALHRFGASSPSWSDQVLAVADGATARVAAAWDTVTSYPGRAAAQASAFARGQLIAAASDFATAAKAAYEGGYQTAAKALEELSDRASAAAAKVMGNLSDAFRNFWGFSPGAIPEALGVGALLLLVGAFALAWSPGGQGAILALGRSAPQLAGTLARVAAVV